MIFVDNLKLSNADLKCQLMMLTFLDKLGIDFHRIDLFLSGTVQMLPLISIINCNFDWKPSKLFGCCDRRLERRERPGQAQPLLREPRLSFCDGWAHWRSARTSAVEPRLQAESGQLESPRDQAGSYERAADDERMPIYGERT